MKKVDKRYNHINNFNRGYKIVTCEDSIIDKYLPGILHVERDPVMGRYETDEEAALAAAKDGVLIIMDEEGPLSELPRIYIDVPKNRANILELCEHWPEYLVMTYDRKLSPYAELKDMDVGYSAMFDYGYWWHGMIAVKEPNALKLFNTGNCQLYRLYPDGTESAVESREDIVNYDGLFGVELHCRR